MAKIIPSGLITDIRGTYGQAVISKSKSGLYAKPLVKPIQSYTVLPSSVRSRYSAIAQQWVGLSNTSKSQWNASAATYTFYNSLNQPFVPTGYQLFIFANMNIYPFISDFITTAYNYVVVPLGYIILGSLSVSGMTFPINWGGSFLLIYLSKFMLLSK